MKQTVVISFGERSGNDWPLHDEYYGESYRRFSAYAASKDTDIIFAHSDSYLGDMQFTSGWHYTNETLTEITELITADLIFVKGRNGLVGLTDNDLIINDPNFRDMAGDKWLTYVKLADFMAPTYQIDNNNWHDVLSKITTEKVVLKPRTESGGKGIIILDKPIASATEPNLSVPYIAQDFVDSSNGISGICDSYHDLRIIVFNGEPKLCFVRMPKQGSLLSNISQGASAKTVPLDQVPTEILDMARAIDQRLSHYPNRVYTSDFFMGPNRPYLVELNTMPGFPIRTAEGYDFMNQFYDCLWTTFDSAIRNHRATK